MLKYIPIILFLVFPAVAISATENLDEIDARKARLSSASWGKAYVEDSTTFVWQPETMMYEDVATGAEVWRLSSTNGVKNSLPDISWAHWSADGKRFSFGSHRDTSANSSAYETNNDPTYQGAVMMMRADGTYLRPADNAPFEVYVHARFLHWSPVEPDVYYGFGRDYAGEGLTDDQLYRVTVGDTSISKQMILDLNTGGETDIKKAISADGTKLVARYGDNLYPITLLTTPSISDSDGWTLQRQLDDYWGQTPSDAEYGLHDQFLLGAGNNIEFYFIPEGYSSWWKFDLSGGAADGGPVHTVDNSAPYSWGGIEPVFTGSGSSEGDCVAGSRSPWNCDGDTGTGPENYLSHPGFDRWGKYVAGVNSQQYQAWGVWDLIDHLWVDANIEAPHYTWHSDWEAWSDYFASAPSGASATLANNIIYTVKYDGTDSVQVANAHIRESSSTDYNSLPRPTQSPDGTKIVYHGDFLYGIANAWDVFYAVAYYPHPPEITSVTGSGTYTIRWDWRTDQTTSRGYTQRGWPDEATDDPPPPRETEKFRLWRSSDGTTWVPVSTVDADIFERYNFSTGDWTGNNYWTITDTPGAGTWYYAVTAVEWSGLESRVLSNVFSTAGSQTAAYPADPKADTGITSAYSKSLKRYYNIYAEDGATPTISQANRIASIPVASGEEYVDWLGNTDGSTQYVVTAVDTQGNESGALSATAVHQESPATAAGQYTLRWSDGRRYAVRVSAGD